MNCYTPLKIEIYLQVLPEFDVGKLEFRSPRKIYLVPRVTETGGV